ncbi:MULTISPECIES: segregation and condensation protein A [Cetobacterium]|uniref:Segregation and condensation protein A n=1 Tax=Cetobacterium somerae ATCC BAA-474 TaxID=1319815 RepID=U7V408_9FUSO|nr:MULTISPECIES: ScpA family protein [Cetobacterium]ERT66280.1 ScpA/B protein [Cetobacterium somerae ATCC BAA-474]MBC2853358.1 segregation/condensation protein A [Cetobacterium sp. 2G large]MCQ9625842.1 segregation/condensation protein A [Cetobacterium somerae]WVJ01524.1 ScpA family protein [Cetobacterium somerae]
MEIVLKIDNFEGPLDLLLHLIEKKKMKISEIKISQIIDEYLQFIEKAQSDSLSVKVEFLEIASELLEIKAVSILSVEKEEEKEKDLKRRLEDYKVFKEVAQVISSIECEYNISYTRKEGRKITKNIPKEFDLTSLKLQDMFNSYVKYLPKDEEYLEIEVEKRYSLKEEMDRIKVILYSSEKVVLELFRRAENRTHLVYIFLAILDLYRDGVILIEGEGNLKLFRRD